MSDKFVPSGLPVALLMEIARSGKPVEQQLQLDAYKAQRMAVSMWLREKDISSGNIRNQSAVLRQAYISWAEKHQQPIPTLKGWGNFLAKIFPRVEMRGKNHYLLNKKVENEETKEES